MTFLGQWQEMLREQMKYRDLLYQIALRDLLLRYKQTVMGFGWAIFAPIMNTLVFSVIFMRVAPVATPMPYPLFAYCGFLTWNLLAASLRFAVPSLVSNANLVTKIYFPREVFPFSAVLVCLVDTAVGAVVLVGMMIYYHIAVTSAVFFLPVVIAVQLAFVAGVALLLSMGNLFYRDVKYLLDVLMTVWMFATSVMYPLHNIEGWLGVLLKLNPMTHIIDAYRQVLLSGALPDPANFGITAVLSVLMLAMGWYVFHQAEFAFAENI